MDRRHLDRIIVTNNSQMDKVLAWYQENKDCLNSKKFYAPLDIGIIELREEALEVLFETKGKHIELSIYTSINPELPAMLTFDYDPEIWTISNYRLAAHLSKERKELLKTMLILDHTDKKEALKYHALMLFMAYYKEVITVKEIRTRTKREAKSIRKDKKRPLSLVRKIYEIESFDTNKSCFQETKRKYTEPEHEVKVRGFYRHYKSGKVIWVAPFSKYKGKGHNQKEYKL